MLLFQVEVILDRARSPVYVFGTETSNARYLEVVLESAYLLVKRVALSPEALHGYNSMLARSPLSIPFVGRFMNSYDVPKGSMAFELELGSAEAELPSFIRLGMIRKAAFQGQYSSSAFNFETASLLRQIRVKEETGIISREYTFFSVAESTKTGDMDGVTFVAATSALSVHNWMRKGLRLSQDEFERGYGIVSLDLSRAANADEEDDGVFSTPRFGRLTLILEFGAKLPEDFTLITASHLKKEVTYLNYLINYYMCLLQVLINKNREVVFPA